jgi:uncharacterized protein YdeI (YjbR/CyaY-like superfamily)
LNPGRLGTDAPAPVFLSRGTAISYFTQALPPVFHRQPKLPAPHKASGFKDAGNLAAWLEEHHRSEAHLLVRIFKVGSGVQSVTWADCVVKAIRFGWIDGQWRALDRMSFLQRLTPRKPGSNWLARNRQHVARLEAEGGMTSAGMVYVEAARADGRWEAAYAGSAAMVIPDDFIQKLETKPAAKAFFATLDRKNLYAIYHRLQTAKRPETWARRMVAILERLDRGERFH